MVILTPVMGLIVLLKNEKKASFLVLRVDITYFGHVYSYETTRTTVGFNVAKKAYNIAFCQVCLFCAMRVCIRAIGSLPTI